VQGVPDLLAPPFHFPTRYLRAKQLVTKQLRTFVTSSAGRLFDTVAALLGFTGEVTFERQAAIWLEQLARQAPSPAIMTPLPARENILDYRPMLTELLTDPQSGLELAEIARKFHRSFALCTVTLAQQLCRANSIDLLVLSGGAFQNQLLTRDMLDLLQASSLEVWMNQLVPPNDGGISLGQAALASFCSEASR
jgi:hydrogenase maturation protein HypF